MKQHAFFKGQLLGEVVGTRDGRPCIKIVGRDLVVPIMGQVQVITTIIPGKGS